MQEKNVSLELPEGVFQTKATFFDDSDKEFFLRIYKNWRQLSEDLKKLKGRNINLPEGLSEGAFALAMDCVRIVNNISGANTSFDCYNLKTKERIQVKACSVIPDLTSFGPKSVNLLFLQV